MDFMVQWFWIVKLLVIIGLGMSVYFLYKSKFKSKFWYAMVAVGAILFFISPVKLDVDTRKQQVRSNDFVKTTKELPPKVEDNSFKQNQQNLGITTEDLPN